MIDRISLFAADTWQMIVDYPSSIWLFVLIALAGVTTAISLLGGQDNDEIAGLTQDGRMIRSRFGRGETLVLRPAGSVLMPFFSVLFFGGLAAAFAFEVLQTTPTPENWRIFYVLTGFAALGFLLFIPMFTRIKLTERTIVRTSLWRPRFTARLDDLAAIIPLGSGIRLRFKNGRPLWIGHNMKGFHQAFAFLTGDDVDNRSHHDA